MNSGKGGAVIQESGTELLDSREKSDLERIEEFRAAKAEGWKSTGMNDNPNGKVHLQEKPVKKVKKELPEYKVASAGRWATTDVKEWNEAVQKSKKDKEEPPEYKVTKIVTEDLRKIAVVGTAESQALAPFKDDSFEIWTLQVSLSYPTLTRYNRLYEMHIKEYWQEATVMERMKKIPQEIDIWMQDKYDEIPNSRKYPLEEIIEGYHPNFTSSIAYMLAHAAYEQKVYQNIGSLDLYGVHMMAEEEYGYQRAGCEYWLGILEALGVAVSVLGTGAVLKCMYNYGYDAEWKMLSDLNTRKSQLNVGLKELQGKLEELKSHVSQQEGALKDVDWTMRRIQ